MLPNEAQPRRSSRALARDGEMDMNDLMDAVQDSIEAHTSSSSSLVSPTGVAPKNPFESLPRRPSTLSMSSAHSSSDEVPRAHRPLPRPPGASATPPPGGRPPWLASGGGAPPGNPPDGSAPMHPLASAPMHARSESPNPAGRASRPPLPSVPGTAPVPPVWYRSQPEGIFPAAHALPDPPAYAEPTDAKVDGKPGAKDAHAPVAISDAHLSDGGAAWEPQAPAAPAAPPAAPPASALHTSVDLALLSQVAQLLPCVIEQRTHVKGSIAYPNSFTGRTVVSAIEALLRQYLACSPQFAAHSPEFAANARAMAMCIARSLKTQLFFHEVDWIDHDLSDGVDEVYMFFTGDVTGAKHTDAEPGAPPVSLQDGEPIFMLASLDRVALAPHAALALSTTPASDTDQPTGVFTPLTACYSPTCARAGAHGAACYARTCPRQGRNMFVRDARPASPGPTNAVFHEAWVQTVPEEIVASLPREEVKRQNAIHEFVQKEDDFCQDLELLGEFARTLRAQVHSAEHAPEGVQSAAPFRAGAELESFIATVFGNRAELARHVAAFVDRLHERQREEHPVVQGIGDVFLSAALEWGPAYTQYVRNYPLALQRLREEAASNPRLVQFLEACRRDARAQRHPVESFLFRATARLQRYHLHLESILKHTAEENEDRYSLQLAIEVADEQCRTAQAGVEAVEVQLQMRTIAASLEAKKAGMQVNMDLLSPRRRLVHVGSVYRRPDSFEFEWTELTAVLFDNFFLLAKRKKAEAGAEGEVPSRLVLSRRPIPVDYLEFAGYDEPSVPRSSTTWRLGTGGSAAATDMYPFRVRHREARRDSFTLYTPSAQDRSLWLAKLEQAVRARVAANAIFQPHALTDDAFPAARVPPDGHCELLTATSFPAAESVRLAALGCADGLWLALAQEPDTLRKVLHLRNVSQVAVLPEFQRVIVLAERALYAYELQALVPSASAASNSAPVKLSGKRDVASFSVGRLRGRTLLAYTKRKTNETSIRVMEPVYHTAAGLRAAPAAHDPETAHPEEFAGFRIYKVRGAAPRTADRRNSTSTPRRSRCSSWPTGSRSGTRAASSSTTSTPRPGRGCPSCARCATTRRRRCWPRSWTAHAHWACTTCRTWGTCSATTAWRATSTRRAPRCTWTARSSGRHAWCAPPTTTATCSASAPRGSRCAMRARGGSSRPCSPGSYGCSRRATARRIPRARAPRRMRAWCTWSGCATRATCSVRRSWCWRNYLASVPGLAETVKHAFPAAG